jgi:large subunit ribosomal protein L15
MKLHDLRPAPGSRRPKRRVGRGIAAGQGKTAGRGTKGQKARAGGTVPAWFEGGQTPLHRRIPKLHGFRNPFRVEFEVVNVGAIQALVDRGQIEPGELPGTKSRGKAAPAPITVNQEILRAGGLVSHMDRPMKVLGGGELSTALFVVADAFSASARSKIEAAGGSVNVLEVPSSPLAALGVEVPAGEPSAPEIVTESAPAATAAPEAAAESAPAAVAETAAATEPEPEAAPKRQPKPRAAKPDPDATA